MKFQKYCIYFTVLLSFAVVLVFTSLIYIGYDNVTSTPTDSIRNKMALELFKANKNKNVVVSPIGIRHSLCALASVIKGPGNLTKRELLSALGMRKLSELNKCSNRLNGVISKLRSYDIMWLNRIFVNYTEDIDDDFLMNISGRFGVDVSKVGFNLPTAATKFINKWVSDSSLRRIPYIVDPGDITPNTTMVVTNGATLKTIFETSFDKKLTKPMFFRSLDNTLHTVPMMNRFSDESFFELKEYDVKAVELKLYMNDAFLMIIVPGKNTNLPSLLQHMNVDPNFMEKLRKTSRYTFVKIAVPKFKIKTYVGWKGFLNQIGITKIFDPNSLSDVMKNSSAVDVHVNHIKQSCFVEMTEGPQNKLGPDETGRPGLGSGYKLGEVRADRPFYFNINLHKYTDQPHEVRDDMFSGVYYGP